MYVGAVGDLRERAWYLWLAFAVLPLSILIHAMAPFEPTFKAQNLAIVFSLVGFALVVILWIPYKSGRRAPRTVGIFLMLIVAAWGLQVAISANDGYFFNHTTYLVPLLSMLLYFKFPEKRDLSIAGQIMGFSLVFILGITLMLGGHLGIPNGFETPESGDTTRIPFITDLLGIDARWGGPFGSVNISSAAGSLLVMLGFFYYRWVKGTFISAGILTLILGQARTSTLALLFALLILIFWSSPFLKLKFRNAIRWIVFLSALALSGLYVAVVDPTFNYRTPTWDFYWGLIQSSPLIGLGYSGVDTAVIQINETVLPGPIFSHGHSIYIDGFARYGILWLLITLGVFILAFYITWIGRNGTYKSTGLAMVTLIFLAGSTETVFSWAYATIYLLALVFTVGLLSDDMRSTKSIPEYLN